MNLASRGHDPVPGPRPLQHRLPVVFTLKASDQSDLQRGSLTHPLVTPGVVTLNRRHHNCQTTDMLLFTADTITFIFLFHSISRFLTYFPSRCVSPSPLHISFLRFSFMCVSQTNIHSVLILLPDRCCIKSSLDE